MLHIKLLKGILDWVGVLKDSEQVPLSQHKFLLALFSDFNFPATKVSQLNILNTKIRSTAAVFLHIENGCIIL